MRMNAGLRVTVTTAAMVMAISGCSVSIDDGPGPGDLGSTTEPAKSPAVRTLNDTGTDWCVNEADGSDTNLYFCTNQQYAQDGNTGRDRLADQGELQKVGGGVGGFDFTKIGPTGLKLPVSAQHWSCVLDNHTGLVWEVKTTDNSIHDATREYYRHDPVNTDDPVAHGRQGGRCEPTEDGIPCNTHELIRMVNENRLCGLNNWRVPTRLELMNIVSNSHAFPAIDRDYFPNTLPATYMSQTIYRAAAFRTEAWFVDFRAGHMNRHDVANRGYVRLVHNQPN